MTYDDVVNNARSFFEDNECFDERDMMDLLYEAIDQALPIYTTDLLDVAKTKLDVLFPENLIGDDAVQMLYAGIFECVNEDLQDLIEV